MFTPDSSGKQSMASATCSSDLTREKSMQSFLMKYDHYIIMKSAQSYCLRDGEILWKIISSSICGRRAKLPPEDNKNVLGYKDADGEEIDKEYERDCEIRIQKLKQDFNIWGSEVRKKEKAYEDEKYAAACRYMLSVTCDDDDDDNLGFYAVHPNTIRTLPFRKTLEPRRFTHNGSTGNIETLFQKREIYDYVRVSIRKRKFKRMNLILSPILFMIFDDEIITNESYSLSRKDLDETILIPPGIDEPCFNAESDLLESLLNRDSPIDSTKTDSIFDEFSFPRLPKEILKMLIQKLSCLSLIILSMFED
ncbi:hypothetical protein Tco_0129276 [Tanacetum coccineum]